MLTVLLQFVTISRDRGAFMLNGEQIVFHGVNVVKKQHPYIPVQDGFDPTESLSHDDIVFMSSNGINLVRLGVMFQGVFPEYRKLNKTYLDEIESLVNELGKHGILTLLDLHQDLLLPAACGEGLPDYLVPPLLESEFPSPFRKMPFLENSTHSFSNEFSPIMRLLRHFSGVKDKPPLHYCLQRNFGIYYASKYVNEVFGHLYSGKMLFGINLTDEFAYYWQEVSNRFTGNEYVMGYDLLNEPFPGNLYGRGLFNLIAPRKFERKVLQPFYRAAIERIRALDEHHLIFLAPNSVNFGETGLKPGHNELLTFHMYCYFERKNGDIVSARLCRPFYRRIFGNGAGRSAKERLPLLVGEFGASTGSKTGLRALADQLQLMSSDSWCYWQFKDFSDITTCFPATAHDNEGLFGTNGPFIGKVALLSHPYLQTFSGIVENQEFNFNQFTLVLKLQQGDGELAYGDVWKLDRIVAPQGCKLSVAGKRISLKKGKCSVVLHFEQFGE